MRNVAATLVIATLALVTVGCGDQDGNDATEGDCNIALVLDGDRYTVFTGLGEPPLAASLGAADQVGCPGDSTVLGSEEVRAIRGISPAVAISTVPGPDGPATVYLHEDQPRDRAPVGWPVELAPDVFE